MGNCQKSQRRLPGGAHQDAKAFQSKATGLMIYPAWEKGNDYDDDYDFDFGSRYDDADKDGDDDDDDDDALGLQAPSHVYHILIKGDALPGGHLQTLPTST